MSSALTDAAPGRPESRREGLLNRVWSAVARWRETPEPAPQGPMVDLRDLMWAKAQAGDLTLGGKPSEALALAAAYLDAGALKPRGAYTSRAYFDTVLDGFGTPRGMVRDEPIQARARTRPDPQREAERSRADELARVWGLDAQGRRTREAPSIVLPSRAERMGKVPERATPAERPAPRVQNAAQTPAATRVYLAVPFAEKDRVKAAGARWDKERKAWFVPEGRDATAFAAWLPDRQKAIDPVAEFGAALQSAGLRVDLSRNDGGQIVADGKMHRVPVEGDRGRELKGAYALWLDGKTPLGWYINFKEGNQTATKWRMEQPARAVDKAEIAKWAAEREARRIADQERLAQQHREAARTAQTMWDKAVQPPQDHPYLVRKGVDGRDARVGAPGQTIAVSDGKGGTRDMSVAGWLIVPVFGKDRGPSNLQFIPPEPGRTKLPLPGAKFQGGHCVIGKMGQGSAVLVCEGWATGKTLHALSGLPVVVAFSAGNLREVAQMVATKHPERTVLVAGDNDHKKEREMDPRTGKPRENVGRVRAEEAARAVGGIAVVPPFKQDEKGSDWNDLAALRGPATARSVLRGMVADAERTAARAAEREGVNAVPFDRGRSQGQRPQQPVQQQRRGHEASAEMER